MKHTWNELSSLQSEAVSMLKNSLTKQRVAHAYLFEGERGTGKKQAGLLFAQSLFCLHIQEGYQACGECANCRRINSGNHPDVHILEPDGLSIKKGQIESLHEELRKKAVESNRKLYMIVHADKMTASAANSLLKFLEEPHPGTTAILLTETMHRMLPTILSRCQAISFKPLNQKALSERLIAEGVSPSKASLIATMTNNVEEGVDLFNDEWFAQAQKIVLKLYKAIQDPFSAMMIVHDEWMPHFKDREQMDKGLLLLLNIYRDLLYINLESPDQIVYKDWEKQWSETAFHFSQRKLADQMTFILEVRKKLSANTNPQLLMEQLVLDLQEGYILV